MSQAIVTLANIGTSFDAAAPAVANKINIKPNPASPLLVSFNASGVSVAAPSALQVAAVSTNVLSSSVNTITSVVNGISRTATAVNSVSATQSLMNSLVVSVNSVNSTVAVVQSVTVDTTALPGKILVSANGVTGNANLFNSIGGSISAPGILDIAINGVSSVGLGGGIDLSTSLALKTSTFYANDGSLTSARTITNAGFNLGITGTGGFGVGVAPASVKAKLDVDGDVIFRAASMADIPVNGPISSSLVNTTSFILANQTTNAITVTIPAPTNTDAGRVLTIYNNGSGHLIVNSNGTQNVIIRVGSAATFVWIGSKWVAKDLHGEAMNAPVVVTTTGNVGPGYFTALINNGGAAITLTLLSSNHVDGKKLTFIRAPGSTGIVVVAPTGANIQDFSGNSVASVNLPALGSRGCSATWMYSSSLNVWCLFGT